MAKKVYSVVSHAERMQNAGAFDYCKPKGLYVDLEESKDVQSYEIDEKSGRAFKKITRKTQKVADKFKDVKVADFSIENLQAIGAVGMLKFSHLSGDMDKSTENIEKLMDHIDAEQASIQEAHADAGDVAVAE